MTAPSKMAVLAVRFRVAQMLDSLVSAVSLFRLVRMMAAVVEESCCMPYPGGNSIAVINPETQLPMHVFPSDVKGGSWYHGLRVHVHSYGMTIVFQDPRSGMARGLRREQVGGYCPVMHAAMSASTAIAKVEGIQRKLGAILSMSAAVHFGGVVLGTIGAQG